MSVTYQPKKRKRAKTHGFLTRSKTSYGKNTECEYCKMAGIYK